MEIRVITYDGYRADEQPKAIEVSGSRLNILEIEDRWIATGVESDSEVLRGFIVRCLGGARFRLEHGTQSGWKGELLAGPLLIHSKP